MRKLLALLLLALGVGARAGSTESDLGHGLTYFRVHQLPGDLPTAESVRKQTCVLDLRYVSGDFPAATALGAWLKFHASPHTPVLVLANGDTGAELLKALQTRGAGVVVLGIAARGFAPDIAVKVSPDVERRAYDALEHGGALASLLNDTPDKPRNDEARLAKEHVTDGALSDEEPAGSKPPTSSPLIDATLQRAVQLHRSLMALKKL